MYWFVCYILGTPRMVKVALNLLFVTRKYAVLMQQFTELITLLNFVINTNIVQRLSSKKVCQIEIQWYIGRRGADNESQDPSCTYPRTSRL